MKLIVAIVQDYDVDALLREVAAADLRATRIASTGGYLRTGNTTVLLGVADDAVERCLRLLKAACRERVDPTPTELRPELPELYAAGVSKVTVGGGVAFVARVAHFERIE